MGTEFRVKPEDPEKWNKVGNYVTRVLYAASGSKDFPISEVEPDPFIIGYLSGVAEFGTIPRQTVLVELSRIINLLKEGKTVQIREVP